MKDISIIVACTTDYGIGYNNTLPWNIPEELKYFRKITTSVNNVDKINAVIMGKNTWYSIPKAPLKNRINIIISASDYDKIKAENHENVEVFKNIQDAINHINRTDKIEAGFIIGGSQLYNDVLENYINNIKLVYMSLIIDKNYTCDKYIDNRLIYNNFNLFEDNVNVNEKYITMVYENKNKNVLDEPPD